MNIFSNTQTRIKSKFNNYNVEIAFVDRDNNILFTNNACAKQHNAKSNTLDGFYSTKTAEALDARIKKAFKRQYPTMMANTAEGLKKVFFIPKLDAYDLPIGVWIITMKFDHECDDFVASLKEDFQTYSFPKLEKKEKKKYEYKHSFAYISMK